jgi:hypothetical protein
MPEFAPKSHENLAPTQVQVVPKTGQKPGSQTQNRAKRINKINIRLLLRGQEVGGPKSSLLDQFLQ